MTEPIIEREHLRKVKEFHESDAERYIDARYGGRNITQLGYVVRRDITYQLMEGVEGNLLDIGCGPGPMIDRMTGQERKLYLLDLSLEMLKEARKNEKAGNGTSHFVASGITELGVRKGVFDGMICVGVIGYVSDPYKAFRELNRVMKMGSVGVIQTSNAASVKEKLYERWIPTIKRKMGVKRKHGFGFEFPLHSYKKKDFDRMLESCGFKIIDWAFYDFHIPFLERFSMGATVRMAQLLQHVSKHRWSRFIAGGYLVKVKKTCEEV